MHVLYLAKTVDKRQYAEQVLNGKLFLNQFACFRKMPEGSVGRADADEVTSIIQHEELKEMDFRFKLGSKSTDDSQSMEVEMGPDDVVSFKTAFNYLINCHVYCLFAGSITAAKDEQTGRYYPTDPGRLLLPATRFNGEMGCYTVMITKPKEFHSRVLAAIRTQDLHAAIGLVRYYDDKNDSVAVMWHPEEENFEPAFFKSRRFAYQQEYRIVIRTEPLVSGPLWLEIGDISDIATIKETLHVPTKITRILTDDS